MVDFVSVDGDRVVERFAVVEEKVNRLIAVCRSLTREKTELIEKVNQLEEQLLQKIEVEEQYRNQKEMVRSKIDSLLEKLDELDVAVDSGQQGQLKEPTD